jgi:hypothetical protein
MMTFKRTLGSGVPPDRAYRRIGRTAGSGVPPDWGHHQIGRNLRYGERWNIVFGILYLQ